MNTYRRIHHKILHCLLLAIAGAAGLAPLHAARQKDFTVVLDAGHGGKDHGAIDNGVKEKDINLAVALKVGELIEKKLKNTKVVYTRDDDTFVSLQGRADIANKAKGDLFISIHTNSVDTKNKNRRTVAGASVYTQGGHKDEANLEVAKRENAVIELENGYEQKYSGFDPNKVESYIIFEMAAKQNLAQSHRFAKNVQDNLVSMAGRKDRGVHQAGFWVLWATSMPSALIELDFICNPASAKFMSSKAGVDKLADAIFEAVKSYEQNMRQKQRMMASGRNKQQGARETGASGDFAAKVRDGVDGEGDDTAPGAIHAGTGTGASGAAGYAAASEYSDAEQYNLVALAMTPDDERKDLSHANLQATRSQRRARHASEGRRRRSADARSISAARDLEVNHIIVKDEFTGALAAADSEPKVEEPVAQESAKEKGKKTKKSKKDKKKSNPGAKKSLRAGADKSTAKNTGNNGMKKADKNAGKDNRRLAKTDTGTRSDDTGEESKREWVSEVNKIAAREKADKKRAERDLAAVKKAAAEKATAERMASRGKNSGSTTASTRRSTDTRQEHAGNRRSLRGR